jgi:Spy/CpxP family protein refolding chaperone
MTMSPIVRARLLGSLVVALAFVAGVMTGLAVERRPRAGLSVTVPATASDRMPRELEQLDLTDAQAVRIRSILVRGRDRVLGVVRDFQPRMREAMDSTNTEIDAVLTPAQRASLAEYRRAHPPVLDQKVIRGKN